MNRRHAVPAFLALGAASFASVARQPAKVWRIGMLGTTGMAANVLAWKDLERSARSVNIKAVAYDVRKREELGSAFDLAMKRRPDALFKGAKPGDLPVEEPERYILTVNLRTAKSLGITIPRSVLIRADEVIE